MEDESGDTEDDELACVKVRETKASEAEVANEEVSFIDEMMRVENSSL